MAPGRPGLFHVQVSRRDTVGAAGGTAWINGGYHRHVLCGSGNWYTPSWEPAWVDPMDHGPNP